MSDLIGSKVDFNPEAHRNKIKYLSHVKVHFKLESRTWFYSPFHI